MLPVRVFFVKKGCSVYISHLDVQRAVIRALIRAGYRMAFTEGFNPHLKLVFAMPLSLYQESTYEIFDFTIIDENVTYAEVLDRLRKVFPSDLMPFAVTAPVKKLALLRAADYTVTVKTDMKAEDIRLADKMIVTKKGKSGESEVDIRQLIRSFSAEDQDGAVVLKVRADCGSQSHLNVAYLCAWLGFSPESYTVVRTALLDGQGELLA